MFVGSAQYSDEPLKKFADYRIQPNLIFAGSVEVRFRPNLFLAGSVKIRFCRTSFWPVRCTTNMYHQSPCFSSIFFSRYSMSLFQRMHSNNIIDWCLLKCSSTLIKNVFHKILLSELLLNATISNIYLITEDDYSTK